MKRLTAIVLSCLSLMGLWGCNPGSSDENPRLKVVTFYSDTLGKDMISQVYLPEGYDSGVKYPVLYFLPSNGGSSYTVIHQFDITDSADRLTASQQIAPMIIVALGIDNSFGVNTGTQAKTIVTSSDKSFEEGPYEDYIVNEAIPTIENLFSIQTTREARYIGGYSMGGFAALHIAFKHPDLFSKVGGHSPSLFLGAFVDKTVSDWLYPSEALRKARDPLWIAQSHDLGGLAVYLDTDSGGVNVEGCQRLYAILMEKGIPTQFNLFSGTHGFAYCRQYMDQYLLFYGGRAAL